MLHKSLYSFFKSNNSEVNKAEKNDNQVKGPALNSNVINKAEGNSIDGGKEQALSLNLSNFNLYPDAIKTTEQSNKLQDDIEKETQKTEKLSKNNQKNSSLIGEILDSNDAELDAELKKYEEEIKNETKKEGGMQL